MSAIRCVSICFALLAACGQSEAASLKVSPAQFIVHDVKPGKEYDIFAETGLRLSVFNDDDVSKSWLLKTFRPSERGRWEQGYDEIPDASWCWFEKPEITIAPNSRSYGHLFLKIPDEEKYYNQHWIVTLGVRGTPRSGSIGLAIDVRMQIETKSKTDTSVRPHGALGMRPSAVQFDDVAPGATETVQVEIYNNDTTAHDYEIKHLLDNEKMQKKTYLSHSYSVIPDTAWITTKNRLHLEGGAAAVLMVKLTLPDEPAHYGQKWEDLLLIEPDAGRAQFVRIQIHTLDEK